MPLPSSGPISMNDIGVQLFGNASGTSINFDMTHVREAIMNKDDPVSLSDYYGVPCGIYKDRSEFTPRVGNLHLDLTQVRNERYIPRKAIGGQSPLYNEDPWEDAFQVRYQSYAGVWSALNCQSCFRESRSGVNYRIRVGYGEADSGATGELISLVVAGYNSSWGGSGGTVYLNETLRARGGSPTIQNKEFTFTKTDTKSYVLVSMQTIAGVAASTSDFNSNGWNNLRIKEI